MKSDPVPNGTVINERKGDKRYGTFATRRYGIRYVPVPIGH